MVAQETLFGTMNIKNAIRLVEITLTPSVVNLIAGSIAFKKASLNSVAGNVSSLYCTPL
jgi:hypothetical protein